MVTETEYQTIAAIVKNIENHERIAERDLAAIVQRNLREHITLECILAVIRDMRT